MSKVVAICNLHNEPSLGELTENRPLGTVSFLGRYGLMTLSYQISLIPDLISFLF